MLSLWWKSTSSENQYFAQKHLWYMILMYNCKLRLENTYFTFYCVLYWKCTWGRYYLHPLGFILFVIIGKCHSSVELYLLIILTHPPKIIKTDKCTLCTRVFGYTIIKCDVLILYQAKIMTSFFGWFHNIWYNSSTVWCNDCEKTFSDAQLMALST